MTHGQKMSKIKAPNKDMHGGLLKMTSKYAKVTATQSCMFLYDQNYQKSPRLPTTF